MAEKKYTQMQQVIDVLRDIGGMTLIFLAVTLVVYRKK